MTYFSIHDFQIFGAWSGVMECKDIFLYHYKAVCGIFGYGWYWSQQNQNVALQTVPISFLY